MRRRARLLAATLFGVVLGLLLPNRLPLSTSLLVGWNATAWTYIAWSWTAMLRADLGTIRRRASEQDEAEWAVLAISLGAAVASMAAIGVELHAVPDKKIEIGHLGLAGATIVASWLFIHTAITLHYARLFYGTGAKPAGGLAFPQTDEPDYLDFLYFSFTIGAAAQTSDVSVTSRAMRRMVLVQTILAFLFNTTVLALAINIGASLI